MTDRNLLTLRIARKVKQDFMSSVALFKLMQVLKLNIYGSEQNAFRPPKGAMVRRHNQQPDTGLRGLGHFQK